MPLLVIFHLIYSLCIGVWMFRFYKTILDLKTRLQEQNQKKHFFLYHLNLFICCKIYLLQNEFVLQTIDFLTEWIFFNRIKLYERECKYLLYFEKRIFTEKNKIFVKIIHIFHLKNMIIFLIVLLHLNNHRWCNVKLFWSYFKFTSGNLCKPVHDIINYSTSSGPFESRKCGKEGKKLQKNEYLKNKKCFFDEIKNISHSF